MTHDGLERCRRTGRPTGLSLTEVLLAIVVVAIALPPIITASTSIARVDRAVIDHAHAANLASLAVEQMHYRLYEDDTRGFRINDAFELRKAAYAKDPAPHQKPFVRFAEKEAAVRGSMHVSACFTRLRTGSDLCDPMDTESLGIDAATHPELVRQLDTYRLTVETVFGEDGQLEVKTPAEPRVDLARIHVRIGWREPSGREVEHELDTRLGRAILEPDPTFGKVGW